MLGSAWNIWATLFNSFIKINKYQFLKEFLWSKITKRLSLIFRFFKNCNWNQQSWIAVNFHNLLVSLHCRMLKIQIIFYQKLYLKINQLVELLECPLSQYSHLFSMTKIMNLSCKCHSLKKIQDKSLTYLIKDYKLMKINKFFQKMRYLK